VTVPDRQHAECLRQVLGNDLGPELVEVEPLRESRSERARAVEEEAAAIGRLGLRHDEIDDNLALRGQERRKASLTRRHLGDVDGHESIEELAGIKAGDLDHAAVGKKRCLHGAYLPDVLTKRKALGVRSQGRPSWNGPKLRAEVRPELSAELAT